MEMITDGFHFQRTPTYLGIKAFDDDDDDESFWEIIGSQ
jgi:hypothetical protein